MSRKSRQRQKPELGPKEPRVEPSHDDRASVHRLTGKLHDMLEAIVTGCAIVFLTSEPDDDLYGDDLLDGELDDELEDELDDEEGEIDLYPDEPTDEELETGIAEFSEAFGGVTLTTRLLARELLAQALGRRPAQPEASLVLAESAVPTASAAAALDSIVETLLPANVPEAIRPSRQGRREAFEEAAWLIREVGLEEFDVSCRLGTSADGAAALFAYTLPPESAHITLLEYLFERAESVADNLDPVLTLERDASAWEFCRWSVSPPPGRGSSEVMEFSAGVREQEYSLVERQSITLGMSVMSELARDDSFAELFPRQHRMAAALAASFVDVFECVTLEGAQATFRSMRDGTTFSVHEHMEPITYAPGWIAAGRLLPFDGDLHLRSPGMIFTQPRDPAQLRVAVEAFANARASLSPALALEEFISSSIFGVRVPRPMKPARSRAEARAWLAIIEDVLDDAALEREPAWDEVRPVPGEIYYTPGLHTDVRTQRDVDSQLDATLQAFRAALHEQAAGGGRDRQERARTKRRRKGKRRR